MYNVILKFKNLVNNNFELLVSGFIFALFIVFSAKWAFLSGRLGWEDESHFWIITKNCTIAQIFDLMKVEGHMMLWYLVVKPFTNLPYPYPMQVLNWLFCLTAMIVMWKKAPFNYFIKILIVFCPIFFQIYSVHARCYSLGCLLLFLACAMYKERLNRPYFYFFILFLSANVHIQTLFAATAIGLVFLYDLINAKKIKEAVFITIMTTFTGIMLYLQFSNVTVPDYENYVASTVNATNMLAMFWNFIPIENDNILLSKIIAARIFVIIMTFVFVTRPRVFFIYLFIFLSSSVFFCTVYLPRFWHIAFYFVYFLVCYWLFIEEKPNEKIIKGFEKYVIILLCILIPLHTYLPHDNDFLYSVVMKHSELHNAKIFTNIWPITISIALPKLNEKGIRIYDMNGRDLSSYEGLLSYYSAEKKKYKPDNLNTYYAKDRDNYLVTLYPIKNNSKYFKKINRKLYIEGLRNGYRYFVYKIKS